MNPTAHNKFGNRSFYAQRLLTATLLALVFSITAFGQAAPVLTLNGNFSTFDFGRLNISTPSLVRVFALSNSGTANLTVQGLALTGVNPTDFTLVSNTCNGATLVPGGTCTASVRFTPLAAGIRNARVTVTDTAAGSQHMIALTGVGINPNVPHRDVGPVDPRHGFPIYYQDDTNLRLALCYDASGFCLGTLPNATLQPSVTDSLINFPGEAFWWSGNAEINIGNRRYRLILSKEAAFTTEDATISNQISFDRVRIRLDGLTPNATYTVTYPFGVQTLVADEDGSINTTEDIGCGGSPCDFSASLRGRVSNFLRWDTTLPAPPAGYIGDPNVNHTVTGSPFSTNFFRVAGPNAGGTGINTAQTNLFAIQGKLY